MAVSTFIAVATLAVCLQCLFLQALLWRRASRHLARLVAAYCILGIVVASSLLGIYANTSYGMTAVWLERVRVAGLVFTAPVVLFVYQRMSGRVRMQQWVRVLIGLGAAIGLLCLFANFLVRPEPYDWTDFWGTTIVTARYSPLLYALVTPYLLAATVGAWAILRSATGLERRERGLLLAGVVVSGTLAFYESLIDWLLAGPLLFTYHYAVYAVMLSALVSLRQARDRATAERRLARVSSALAHGGEQDRADLAEELHDRTIAHLAEAAGAARDAAEQYGPGDAALADQMDRINESVSAAQWELQTAVSRLRSLPPTGLGLGAVLGSIGSDLDPDSGVKFEVFVTHEADAVSADVAGVVNRVARELVSSAAAHSCPRSIVLRVWCGHDQVHASVSDDGNGLGAEALSRGLAGHDQCPGALGELSRIGGTITIRDGFDSRGGDPAGRGSTVIVSVPEVLVVAGGRLDPPHPGLSTSAPGH